VRERVADVNARAKPSTGSSSGIGLSRQGPIFDASPERKSSGMRNSHRTAADLSRLFDSAAIYPMLLRCDRKRILWPIPAWNPGEGTRA